METGWWNPEPYKRRSKFHYVGTDGRSLCRRWGYIRGSIEEGQDNHSDNCAICRKKKAARPKGVANDQGDLSGV